MHEISTIEEGTQTFRTTSLTDLLLVSPGRRGLSVLKRRRSPLAKDKEVCITSQRIISYGAALTEV